MQTIIIAGGGVAGLMAAYELSAQHKKVILLEATDRLGGRIHTYTDDLFSMPVELGAEFIHGNLPVTLSLLKEAGIKYYAVKGKPIHLKNGKLEKQDHSNDYWNDAMKQMKTLKEDMPLSEFLIKFFNEDKYESLRRSIKGFAEGFDLADVSKASTLSLYNEWSHEATIQYRIEGGYKQLVNYLESECKKNGCVIYNNCCIKKINWSKDQVNVITMCSRYFKADKIIIAVPLSVLQADKNDVSYIEFTPAIDNYIATAKDIGFGTVIKIIFEFDEAFWEAENLNAGFILTSDKIPVWWTQLPDKIPVLTGWLGGPNAFALKNMPDEELLLLSLQSLASAFNLPADTLQKKLKAYKIVNWINVPNIYGGYSYNMVESIEAKKLLQNSIDKTIFFAGEAMYEGTLEGTVEAALISGKKAAEKIIKSN